MTDLLRELEETSVFLKEYKDMRIALDICTEYMDDQRNIVNNALARIKAKEVILNLELKNFEEDMVKIEKEQIPESLLKKETNHE